MNAPCLPVLAKGRRVPAGHRRRLSPRPRLRLHPRCGCLASSERRAAARWPASLLNPCLGACRVAQEWLATLATIEEEDSIYEDFVTCARRLEKELRDAGVDLVVAVTHMR